MEFVTNNYSTNINNSLKYNKKEESNNINNNDNNINKKLNDIKFI